MSSSTITRLLTDYWTRADSDKATLDRYRDAYGEPDDDELTAYDDARTTIGLEAVDFLDRAMAELAAEHPLPLGLEVTVPGANGARFTLTTGQLDRTAQMAFVAGQCHALARALSEATGWPMAVLISDSCSYDPDMCSYSDDAYGGLCACRFEHVVVRRPDGALVDIRGAFLPATVPGWEGQQAIDLDEHGWQFLCRSPAWRRPAVEVARTFTAPLLDALATP
ncbi:MULTISPECIES: hypothetical protein [unclassified Streptomyces]|uniref:hypothetical protein n=1 Tax=unclassified Streptomyces TaxID=2593676 RepID=UPI00332A8A19